MANTLNLGTDGNWATKEGSLLGYNSESNNYKPLPFTFTRASKATVINKDGLIETVGSGQPRIDYKDDSEGALKLEPQSTNYLLQSNSFDTTWTKSNATIASGQSGYDGSNDAWLLTATNTFNRVVQSISQSGVKRFSVYAKANANDYLLLGSVEGAHFYATFNLATGAVDSNNINAISPSIEDVGNGWYRCSATWVNTTTEVRIGTQDASGQGAWASTTSGSIYIQDAQLEQGSYATSYIPTQGSAVTRLADVCNNGANEQVINSTEGVLYAEIKALNETGGNRYISLSDGTDSNRILLRFQDTDKVGCFVRDASGSFAEITKTSASISLNFLKVAVKWKTNDVALWVNGVEVGVDSSFTTFNANVLNRLNLTGATTTTSQYFYGNVKDLKVYNTALTDSELQALTS